jgi:peptidoglycan/xylan/chitin deacetylase (PgdA/CDA1 family)
MTLKPFLLAFFAYLFETQGCGSFGIDTHLPRDDRRRVAITFDDLPAVAIPSGTSCDLGALEDNTARLLATLTAHHIPTIGFVNEGRLCKSMDPAALAVLLRMWVDRGEELGNHTFSHVDLDVTTPTAYEGDIVRGEAVTRKVLSEKGKALRYFRHPNLNTGRDAQTKAAIEMFLAQHGYLAAPVTIGSNEWMFAAIYADAKDRGDLGTMRIVAEAYIPYMRTVFEYYEKASLRLFAYEARQILLLHASALNADNLEPLLAMIQSRGYQFISLEEALQDRAYHSRNTYLGSKGFSWFLRWAETRKIRMNAIPAEPKLISKLYKETLAR